ncbi:MAG: 16S rRNA (uracil(1498)-N(3))-methyltransferase [Ruminococcaceae bacterium]|nr:16S rRNA (uracil(1498)-N(3))-methyltransferase [Oscillospiraceae bacterium]
MPKFFLPKETSLGVRKVSDVIEITGDDARHISRTLRMKVSDSVTVSNSEGTDYLCEIDSITSDTVYLKILSVKESDTESSVKSALFQALIKYDKMDTVIQKAVELGVSDIYPVESRRSIVKLDKETKIKKVERWNKIALEASKQCGRGIIPVVHEVIDLNICAEILKGFDKKFFCYESAEGKTIKDVIGGKDFSSVGFFIGPEGGIAPEEAGYLKNSGIEEVSLGRLILRTETAGPAVLSMILYETQL